MEKMKYADSNVSPEILRGVAEMGFVHMTPIQELTIPVLLEGKDIIGQAQTGTGKTASFGIPLIQKIDPKGKGVQGLILCPTRELAMQAAEELRKLAKYTHGVKVVPIYGGQDIDRQIRLLKSNVSIVVGTPGRVMDHMRRRTLKFDNLKMLVLDEADEMLNMGFREDMETICQELPDDKQTALFSATMPEEILRIAATYQHNATLLKVKQEELTIPLVKQFFYVVKGKEKDTALCRLIDYMSPKKALIFCNTKKKVDELTLMLKGRGYYAEGLHGDLSQHQRDRVMNLFRKGTLELLLATDVAARGIDVDNVEMVFNYDMPQDMEYYVHRIGRTGRAGKKGSAFSIITSREMYKIKSLREFCNADIVEKDLPTAASVNSAKAYKTLNDAMEFAANNDLSELAKIIYLRSSEEDMNVIDIAAAFLRMTMGEPLEESEEEKNDSRRHGRRDGKRREGSRDGRRREGGRDGRRSEGKEGRKGEGRDSRKGDSHKGEGRKGDSYKGEGSHEGRKSECSRDGKKRDRKGDGYRREGRRGESKFGGRKSDPKKYSKSKKGNR